MELLDAGLSRDLHFGDTSLLPGWGDLDFSGCKTLICDLDRTKETGATCQIGKSVPFIAALLGPDERAQFRMPG